MTKILRTSTLAAAILLMTSGAEATILSQVGAKAFDTVTANEDFESLPFSPGTPFSSGGFDFNLLGSGGGFVIAPVGFSTKAAYDNGGGNTVTQIRLTSGGDIEQLQLDVSNGYAGAGLPHFIWLRTYNNGSATGFDFDFDLVAPSTLAVWTDGTTVFDEIRVAAYSNAASRDLHDETTASATSSIT